MRLSQRYYGEGNNQAEEEHCSIVEDGQVSTAERPDPAANQSYVKVQQQASNEYLVVKGHQETVTTQSPMRVDLGMTNTMEDMSKLQTEYTGGKYLSHQRNNTLDSINNTATQNMTLTLPALVPTYQPYKKSVSL